MASDSSPPTVDQSSRRVQSSRNLAHCIRSSSRDANAAWRNSCGRVDPYRVYLGAQTQTQAASRSLEDPSLVRLLLRIEMNVMRNMGGWLPLLGATCDARVVVVEPSSTPVICSNLGHHHNKEFRDGTMKQNPAIGTHGKGFETNTLTRSCYMRRPGYLFICCPSSASLRTFQGARSLLVKL